MRFWRNVDRPSADISANISSCSSVSGKHLTMVEIQHVKKAKKKMEWEDVQAAMKDFAKRAVDYRFAPTR
jgi:hypothetical protein